MELLKSYIDDPEKLTDEDLLNILSLYQICDGEVASSLDGKGEQIVQNVTGLDIMKRLQNISESSVEIENFCFASVCDGDSSWVAKVMTEEGLCYNFNMLRYADVYEKNISYMTSPDYMLSSNWTIFGYQSYDFNAYPFRSLGRGINSGLKIKLKMKVDDIEYACKESASGFRLVLHTPGETPRPSSHFYRIPFHAKTLVAVNPRVVSTSNDLKSYKVEKRQCYFEGEKKLKYYKLYSQSNCQLECSSSL